MVDTIVLTLKEGMYTILYPDRFNPSANRLNDMTYRLGGRANMYCTQNPSQRELKAGIYKPRLTLTKRVNKEGNFEMTLKIEFSIPKLLFKNNFDELENDDFYDAVIVLAEKLKEMGVYVSESNLVTALVSSIHFSKNIALTDYTLPSTYIEQLAKLNINKRLDTNQTDFRNEGHSFKYRANSFEIAFYDKLKDLAQSKISEKRAEEKDNAIQMELLDPLTKPKKKPFEVLRMEARLNKRRKIKQILKKVGIKHEPTFSTVFQQATSQKVLLYYLSEIENSYPPLLTYRYETPKEFFTELLVQNPAIKLSDALAMSYLRILFEEMGVRGFREIIKRYGSSVWYSLNKKMKNLNKPSKSKHNDIFSTLRKELTIFKPLKLIDFKEEMINNDKYD